MTTVFGVAGTETDHLHHMRWWVGLRTCCEQPGPRYFCDTRHPVQFAFVDSAAVAQDMLAMPYLTPQGEGWHIRWQNELVVLIALY